MSMVNLVAVTMRLAPAPDYDEPRDAISHDWISLLERLGLAPVLVPNGTSNPVEFLQRSGASRLLLTNGDSLGPLQGEPGGPAPTLRDSLEFALLEYAVENGMPVLGACRGLQVINAWFGGGLTRDLELTSGENHSGHAHTVEFTAGGDLCEVNSYHDEGVLASQVVTPLKVTAHSPGGVVEGLAHTSLPVWGIQWHPERAGSPTAVDREILQRWVDA